MSLFANKKRKGAQNMLRKIIVPKENHYLVDIPREYLDRQIEILIFPYDLEYESEQDEQTDEDSRLFWESFGSWQDERTAETIIEEIYSSRTSTERELQL
jgi:hypothetical protein